MGVFYDKNNKNKMQTFVLFWGDKNMKSSKILWSFSYFINNLKITLSYLRKLLI